MISDAIEGVRIVPQHIPAEDLLSLVPHKGKMFLLSRVTAHDIVKNSIVSEYDVSKNCILYDEDLDGIPVWAGFEMMAQSISALSTIERIAQGKPRSAAPGVILSVSNFRTKLEAIRTGQTVVLSVSENYRVDNVCRYDCELYERGCAEPVATTAITVMGIQDMHSFFSGQGS